MFTEPTPSASFSSSSQALEAAIAAVDVSAYARSRNHLDGRVTRLSPYITHGLTNIAQLFLRLQKEKQLSLQDKLAFEFGWREFFHHVWHHHGDAIFSDMRTALPGIRYATTLPADIREARTGIAAIDRAVETLYQTGYLHNHARMWLASYVVHLRKIHWRAGADWLYGHLLDGDLASNHLSWQWVAATFSNKPYLFNAENVAKFASEKWHCAGTPIDTSYETLEHIARNQLELARSTTTSGLHEPALLHAPKLSNALIQVPAGARIKLIHPWMLEDAPYDGLRIGCIHLPFHARFPWSQQRWDFVLSRMQSMTDMIYVGELNDLCKNLTHASALESVATLNPEYQEALTRHCSHLDPTPLYFAELPVPCRSFSAFWSKCTASASTAPNRNWHQ